MKKVMVVMLLVLFAGLQAQAATVVVQDDFNRGDNWNLGAPWQEDGNNTNKTRVESNAMRINRSVAAYQDTGNYARIAGLEAWEDFDVNFKLKVTDGFNTSAWVKFCVGVEATGWVQDGWSVSASAGTGLSAYASVNQWVSGSSVTKNQAFFKKNEWTNITISVRGNEATITSASPSRGTISYSLPTGTIDRNYDNTQYFAIITHRPANATYDAVIDDFNITGITAVPEPSTMALLGLGTIAGLVKKK